MNQQALEFNDAKFNSDDRDVQRLRGNMRKIHAAMSGGKWMTLKELADLTNVPEATASAALRTLRNRYGFVIEAKRKPGAHKGTWIYCMVGRSTRQRTVTPRPRLPAGLEEAIAAYAVLPEHDVAVGQRLREEFHNWAEGLCSEMIRNKKKEASHGDN